MRVSDHLKFIRRAVLSAVVALPVAASLVSGAPAFAAENGRVTRVQLAFEGSCTAEAPTTFGTSYGFTATTHDLPDKDIVQIYHLDGNNTVVSRNTGYAGSLKGEPGRTYGGNAFTRIVATPATQPYTAVLYDATTDVFAYEGGATMDMSDPLIMATLAFDMNALDSDCPGAPDTTPPTVTLSSSAPGSVAAPFTLTATFSEDVTGFDASDLTVGNGTASNFSATSATVYTATISPSTEGATTVDVAAGAAQDGATNASLAATQFSITYDTTAPTAAITSTASGTVGGAFPITVTFSETVTGFAANDFAVGNGTMSNFSATSGTIYTATVTPTADGPVTVDIAGGAANDTAGNASTVVTQFSVTKVTLPIELTLRPVSLGSDGTCSADATTAFVVGANRTGITDDDGAGYDYFSVFVVDANNLVIADNVEGRVAVGATDTNAWFMRMRRAPGPANFRVIALDTNQYFQTGSPTVGDTYTSGAIDEVATLSFNPGLLDADCPGGDTTPPTVILTASATSPVTGPFEVTATFSEDVSGFDLADFDVTNGAASSFLTVSASVYTATITPAADGDVIIALAADAAQDAASNASEAATSLELAADITAPDVVLSAAAGAPVSGAFTLDIVFTEAVTGFALDDLTVGNGAASDLAGSDDIYSVTITPAADGDVTVDLAAAAAQDVAGNDNTAAAQFALAADVTAPSVVLSTVSLDPVSGAFTLDIVFSEVVTGFAIDDLTVGNGAASDLAGSDDIYSVTITPAADGDVTVDIAAAAAQDGAGNDNLAATQFVISSDVTPPSLTLTLPGTEAEGAFTVSFAFSEDVTGFDLADLVIVNGDASDFTATSASAYSAVITPQTLGTVTISVAAAAAQDSAGNDSEAGSASLEAISRPITVEVVIAEDVVDVTDISATATITNPGSQPVAFHVEVDVPWIDVDPTSGTIPSLGELVFTISVNALAENLSPGAYTGTITVINDSGGSAIAKGPGVVSRASGDSIVVEIPLTITIAERYGSLQLVATTPGGLQRDESFVFASSDSELDGLSLTTSGGRAASAEYRRLFGTYDVTQALSQGWRLAALSCVGDTDNGSVIDLANGRVDIDLDPNENIVCTFANTRDEAEIVLATQRAIRNFMVRRADRILSAAPDLASRMRDRETTSPGNFAADINGGNRTISLGASLSGIRNHAKAQGPQMPGDIPAQGGADSALDIWLAADYSAMSDERAGDAADSEFGVIQIGADWRVAANTLVGVMVQRDWMDETADDIAQRAGAIRGARVGGTGWMAGPYLVHELGQGAFIDVLAMWGKSDNTVDPLGLYEDDFSTSRYMVRANLTGEWASGQWRIRPSASIAHFEETQDAYTDSLGIAIPEQTIAIGRIEAGPQIAYHIDTPSGGWWEPSLDVTAVWDYDAAQLMDENGGLVGTGGVRADARLGVRGQLAPGASLAVETTFSGLGDGDFSANGARMELRINF